MIFNDRTKIILFLACLFTGNARGYCQGNNVQGNSIQEPQQQIKDFSIAGFGEKGKKNWDLTGKSADITDDQIIKLNSIEGNFYTGTEDVRLTADKGDFDKLKNKVHVEDNVIITTSSGTKMTTDSLNWDRGTQLLETKDVVNIERSNMTATSVGATGRPDLNKVNLEKDVVVKIDKAAGEQPKGGDTKEIIITCDGPLEVNYQDNMATFKNNVKVDMGDSIIVSDVMDVYFSKSADAKTKKPDPGSDLMGSQIDKIVARGNVKIIRGENVSYSDEAVYSSATRKITLSGKPKLILYTSKDKSGGLLGKPALSFPSVSAQNKGQEGSIDSEKKDVIPDFEAERAKAIEAALGAAPQ